MSNERFLNYSQLLSTLVEEKDEILNEVTATFLYQLFPNDMFVKAFSLLESNTIFVYTWNLQNKYPRLDANHESTNIDFSSQTEAPVKSGMSVIPSKSVHSRNDVLKLFESMYEKNSNRLTRIVVQQIEKTSSQEPICIDVDAWFCSCRGYAKCLADSLNSSKNAALSMKGLPTSFDILEGFIDGTEDEFAKIKPGVYVNVNKILCEHLLAASILLKTSTRVLKYFAENKATVSVFVVNNKDDWLKLHFNLLG